jgi:hypothetical protein
MNSLQFYTKLGTSLRVYAVFTVFYFLLDLVNLYLVSISALLDFIGFIIFLIEIAVIVYAKKAASEHAGIGLDRFGNFMIGAIIFSIVGIIIVVAEAFQVAYSEVTSGSGTIDVLPVLISADIVSLITVILELLAWNAMAGFFKGKNDVDNQGRGIQAAWLVIIATVLALATIFVVGFPESFIRSTIVIGAPAIPPFGRVLLPYSVMDILLIIASNLLAIIGYFKLATLFQGVAMQPAPASPGLSPQAMQSFANPSRFQDGLSPQAMRAQELPSEPVPSEKHSYLIHCPVCGKGIMQTDPPLKFCASCGSRLFTDAGS